MADEMNLLADDITAAAKAMADDGTDGESLRLLIDCVAHANRLAGLLAEAGRS